MNTFTKPRSDIPSVTDHVNNFESSSNASLASTSSQLKGPNTNNKSDLHVKKFNSNSENIIEAESQRLTPLGDKANKTPTTNGAANGNRLKIDEKLEKMKWFHGLLTRDMAEKLLVKDGDYLVRETNKADRQYVLSGKYKGECRHIFLVDPSGVVSETFNSY